MNAIIQQTELNIFIKAFLERICALERGEILIKKHLTLLSKELEENEEDLWDFIKKKRET